MREIIEDMRTQMASGNVLLVLGDVVNGKAFLLKTIVATGKVITALKDLDETDDMQILSEWLAETDEHVAIADCEDLDVDSFEMLIGKRLATGKGIALSYSNIDGVPERLFEEIERSGKAICTATVVPYKAPKSTIDEIVKNNSNPDMVGECLDNFTAKICFKEKITH